MKLSIFKNYMIPLYFASLRKKGFAVNLKGRSGHGKTWTLEQFPALMKEAFPDDEYGIRVIEGASLTMSGALGYMWPKDDEERDIKATTFTEPFWKYTKEGRHLSTYKGGLIIIDDWHLIDPELKKIMSQGAYEGYFANHALDEGWVIWFCGNRPQDRSGATRDYEHTTLRQITVEISDDLEGLVEALETGGAMPVTVEFAKKYAMDHIYVPAPKDIEPYCTPRTLAQSDMFLQELKTMFGMDEVPTDANVVEFIQGSVGKSAAADYMVYLEEENALPKYAEIIRSPTTVKMPPIERPDLWRLQAYKLATDVKAKDTNAALTYMERFPKEFQTIFVSAIAKNPLTAAFTLQPKVREWMKRNMLMVATITGMSDAAE